MENVHSGVSRILKAWVVQVVKDKRKVRVEQSCCCYRSGSGVGLESGLIGPCGGLSLQAKARGAGHHTVDRARCSSSTRKFPDPPPDPPLPLLLPLPPRLKFRNLLLRGSSDSSVSADCPTSWLEAADVSTTWFTSLAAEQVEEAFKSTESRETATPRKRYWSEFLATDPEILGLIPAPPRFSLKQWVCLVRTNEELP
ncbi:unnamed protein product [Timema podura]|uniref:Uncharacterized protein n=1 Tax=Timema podura TaxID=61482 RepID=A0ABN7NP09_TIMPD|nr:unnamed protein product [Timema podura]